MLAADLKLPAALAILYRNAGPVTRRKALTKASLYLMQVNKRRIKANRSPDGSAMTERLDTEKGRMFRHLPAYLQRSLHADLAHIGFAGRMGWVASHHQLGQSVRYPNYTADLPVRELLGINGEDAEQVKRIVLEHLMDGVQ